jgi:hypothetical protein
MRLANGHGPQLPRAEERITVVEVGSWRAVWVALRAVVSGQDSQAGGRAMKVLAGRLSDADRRIIFESNESGRPVLIATLDATVTYDQRRPTPYDVAPMQAVGVAKTWDHGYVELGGWSFTTRIPWTSIVAVWWRDEAPSAPDVAARIAEFQSDTLAEK